MAITIETAPENFAFINAPIGVKVKETDTNFRRFTYKVAVNSVESELFEATRDSANEAILDLSHLLKVFFEIGSYALPDLASSSVQPLNNDASVVKTYLLTCQSQFTTGSPSTQTTTKRAVWGGKSYFKKSTDVTLSASLTNSFAVLSPFREKTTTPTAREYLTLANIFLDDAQSIAATDLQYNFYDEDNTLLASGSVAVTRTNFARTAIFDVSYSKIVAPNTALKPAKYTVQLVSTVPVTLVQYKSQLFTFTVDYDYKPQTTEFLFINSKGGLSTIRLYGEREDDHEATREETERYLSPFATLPTSPAYSRINAEAESFKIATGYYENWQDFQEVLDLFRSEAIWEIVENTLVPVALESKKMPTYNSNKIELASSSLEFRYLVSRHAL